MKLLSTFFICIALAFGSTKASAQVYTFKATSFSIMEKSDSGKWGKWSDFEESTVVITLDGKKDRLVVGSKEPQVYKIMSYGKKLSTEFEDTIPLNCMALDGGACTILIVTRVNQKNRKQIYINFADVKIVYNIY